MAKTVIQLQDIHFSYGDKEILRDLNLSIKEGSFLGMIGPNGGGKTSLIRLILGQISPDQGEIKILGQSPALFKEWNKVGFVSQTASHFNRGFPATVFEVVAMGLTTKLGFFRFLKKTDKEKIMQTLELVNMKEYARQKIGKLSGGQQQRVFIARALVSDPEIIILDEPTVGVDYKQVSQFYELLQKLNREKNLTLILITHDIELIGKYATHIACINKRLQFYEKAEDYASIPASRLAEYFAHPMFHQDSREREGGR